jgi:LmbE family N-acetylglucosaminyl deacetylase
MELRRDIARVIRQTKPDVVVTMDPSVIYAANLGFINHPDHRAAGQATLDAVYPMARDHLSFPELLTDGLEPHTVATALLVNFDHHNFCVDISDTIQTKLDAWAAHTSQDSNVPRTQEMMRDIAEECGKSAGCKCAEAFMRIDFR